MTPRNLMTAIAKMALAKMEIAETTLAKTALARIAVATTAIAIIAVGLPATAVARSNPPLQAEFELPGVTTAQEPPVLKPEALSPGPYQPAPMPNQDLLPPHAPLASDPSLRPHLFMPPDRFAGDGYSAGSTVQTEQERRMRPAAGFSLQLPLH